MKLTKNMTEGNIYRSFLVFAGPLILSLMLSQAYSTIDAVIAGKFISENALGAISATGSYELLLHSLFSGFAAGFGIYTAQQFGKGDYGALKRDVVSMGIFICTVAGMISLISILLRDPIFTYLKVDPIVRPDAEVYFVIFTMGLPESVTGTGAVCHGHFLRISAGVLYCRSGENRRQPADSIGAGRRCGRPCLFYGAVQSGYNGLLSFDPKKSFPGAEK